MARDEERVEQYAREQDSTVKRRRKNHVADSKKMCCQRARLGANCSPERGREKSFAGTGGEEGRGAWLTGNTSEARLARGNAQGCSLAPRLFGKTGVISSLWVGGAYE